MKIEVKEEGRVEDESMRAQKQRRTGLERGKKKGGGENN